MLTVTATHLRNQLFEYLSHLVKGETIAIQWNGREVGRIVPAKKEDWRKGVTTRAKIVGSPEIAFAPLKDEWIDYL